MLAQQIPALFKRFLEKGLSVQIQKIKGAHDDLNLDIFNIDVFSRTSTEDLKRQKSGLFYIVSHRLSIHDETRYTTFTFCTKSGQNILNNIWVLDSVVFGVATVNLYLRSILVISGHVDLGTLAIIFVFTRECAVSEAVQNHTDAVRRFCKHRLQRNTSTNVALLAKVSVPHFIRFSRLQTSFENFLIHRQFALYLFEHVDGLFTDFSIRRVPFNPDWFLFVIPFLNVFNIIITVN
mmetsp:Transcript_12459/g.24178  ORF Transcript_12459/g.24178 Transcript_12459/m.24178 type:complete len:236 (+) Transcript_12459:894-1601(+)